MKSIITDPAAAPALCFKLINTLNSDLFHLNLDVKWQGSDRNENIGVIQLKSKETLQNSLELWKRSNVTTEDMKEYLTELQFLKNINLLEEDKEGEMERLDAASYHAVDLFICETFELKVNKKVKFVQFEFNSFIRAIIDYFLIKNTIENGTESNTLNKIIELLLTTKPKSFFEDGFLSDLFVCDQVMLFKMPKLCKNVISNKKSLSTFMELGSNKIISDKRTHEVFSLN